MNGKQFKKQINRLLNYCECSMCEYENGALVYKVNFFEHDSSREYLYDMLELCDELSWPQLKRHVVKQKRQIKDRLELMFNENLINTEMFGNDSDAFEMDYFGTWGKFCALGMLHNIILGKVYFEKIYD